MATKGSGTVYRVTEVIGTSSNSWEDAVRSAVKTAAGTLREFDDAVTAPLHGFRNTDDYWTRASSKPGLANIRIPTLIINARNDPFLPARALPPAGEVSDSVALDQPEEGGHAAFVSGRFPGHLGWLPERVMEFFSRGWSS